MSTQMQPTYYKLLAVVAIAGSLAASLMLLQGRSPRTLTQAANEQAAAPASSGNANADRVHELKELEEELKKKPGHTPILFRLAQLSGELGQQADAGSYLRRLLQAEPGNIEARLELVSCPS